MNNDADLYSVLNLKKRQPLNIVFNLFGRELGTNSCTLYTVNKFNDFSNRNEQTIVNLIKRTYLSFTPNFSVLNVKIPNCFLRKFSPDGRYLISFNQNLNGIQIYTFRGCSAALEHLEKFVRNSNHDKTDFNNSESDHFRYQAFDIFFKEKCNMKLTDNTEQIHRECALFFKDSYLIVASNATVNDDNLPSYDQLATNNESIHYSTIENYTIYLIDIQESILCDKIKFNAERINLTHNQSLSLFNNVFAVLSQQNQTIYIYHLVDSSEHFKTSCKTNRQKYKFQLVNQIGRFTFSDDNEFITNFSIPNVNMPRTSAASLTEMSSSHVSLQKSFSRRYTRSYINPTLTKGFAENCFTGMKQRIISYFYQEAVKTNTVSQFYLNLTNILKLKMYKMQLLDDRYILIKYVNVDHLVCHKSTITITNRTNVNNATANGTSSPVNNNSNIQPISSSNTITASVSTLVSSSTNTPNSAIGSLSGTSATGSNSTVSFVGDNQTNSNVTTIPMILNENTVPFYFVFYDTKTTKIVKILRNSSPELLHLFENFQDYFTLASSDNMNVRALLDLNNETTSNGMGVPLSFHTLASNNIYANQLMKRHVKNMLKFNSISEMTKCLLSQLPISSQSYTTTPYLDHSLFSYDEKLISNLERPKPIGDQIIKFNIRESGRLCFRMYSGIQMALGVNSSNQQQSLFKRLVAFIWHPREPFCISVQRVTHDYNVNFHIYSKFNLI